MTPKQILYIVLGLLAIGIVYKKFYLNQELFSEVPRDSSLVSLFTSPTFSFNARKDVYLQADLSSDSPEELQVGRATRFLQNDKLTFEVEAYLFTLNNNPFGPKKTDANYLPQSYTVVLKKNGSTKEIGEMKLGHDGVYRLRFVADTKDTDTYAEYSSVGINYNKNRDAPIEILSGNFVLT